MTDVDTTDFSGLFAELKVGLSRNAAAVDGLRRWMGRAEGVFSRVVGADVAGAQGVAPAAGRIIFNLGGPEQGQVWQVRGIVCGGLTRATTAAGTADVYVCGQSPADESLVNLRDNAQTLPQVAIYGRGDLAVSAWEQLWVVVKGATAGQQYVCAASIEGSELGADVHVI